jgi:glycosyltransferase involved in cell wall biosynthesis
VEETVDVIVPLISGSHSRWQGFAERAMASAEQQTVRPTKILLSVAGTVAIARNEGGFYSRSDWLIFLDADDELDPYYVEAMMTGRGDIRYPRTLGVVDGKEDDYAVQISKKPSLLVGNHLVIGSMVRRQLFNELGGFRNFPILEDWDFWIRCALAGADMQPCPDAIYRVHVQEGSRNTNLALHGNIYQQIQQEHQGPWLAKFGAIS